MYYQLQMEEILPQNLVHLSCNDPCTKMLRIKTCIHLLVQHHYELENLIYTFYIDLFFCTYKGTDT